MNRKIQETWWRRVQATAMAVGLLAVAACGASDSSSSNETVDQVIGGDAEGAPIVIGAVCSCTGAFPFAEDVVDAWAENVNATGGINGHPVKVVLKDDASDPTKTLQLVKELVEQEKVVAIASFLTTTDSASEYLKSKNIPVIGPDNGTSTAGLANFFDVGTTSVVGTLALLDISKRAGKEKLIGMLCSEYPGCAFVDNQLKDLAPVVDMDYKGYLVSLSAPDYTAQCIAGKQDGGDALNIALTPDALEKVVSQCAGQGWEPTIVQNYTVVFVRTVNDPQFDGLRVWSATANYMDESIPGAKAYVEALKKYQPELLENPQFGGVFTPEWASLEIFKAAAEDGDIGPSSTSDDVLAGLYALEDETVGGLVAPTTYVEGEDFINKCYFELEVKDGALVSTNGAEPTCIDQAQFDEASQAVN